MSYRYPRIYKMLKRTGFSPAKAVEILYDARRGSKLALSFIRTCRHLNF